MEEQILTTLKTKYRNLGFGDKALSGVAAFLAQTVTEENGVEPAVTGAEPLLKAFQSDIDARVTSAVEKTRKELKPADPKPADPKPADPPKPGDDVPAWAKGLMEKFEALEKREVKTSLVGKAKAKLAEKKIPESFLRGRSLDIESEADIDNLVASMEADYTAFRQDLVNQGVIVNNPQEGGGDKADAAIAKMIAEKRNNPTVASGVVGKKLI